MPCAGPKTYEAVGRTRDPLYISRHTLNRTNTRSHTIGQTTYPPGSLIVLSVFADHNGHDYDFRVTIQNERFLAASPDGGVRELRDRCDVVDALIESCEWRQSV